jgi:hypothetical protein
MASNSSSFMDASVVVDCSAGNDYTSANIGARVSAIFVILVGSALGVCPARPWAMCALHNASR